MPYPVNYPNFSGVTPSSVGTPKFVGGYSLTATANATYNSIDVSGINNVNGMVYWQIDAGGAATSFSVEAVMTLDSDANGNEYIGLGVTTDGGTSNSTTTGDQLFFAIRNDVALLTGRLAGVSVNLTAAALRNTGAAGFVVGATHTLKVSVHLRADGMQELAWYWDGVLVALVGGIKTPFSFKPAIMSYGNVVRLLSLTGVSPSAQSAYTGGCNVPASKVYRYITRYAEGLALPRTVTGVIQGIVTIEGDVASRKVRLYNKPTGRLVAEVMSGLDGSYMFTNLDPSFDYFAVAHDYSTASNAVIADYLKAI